MPSTAYRETISRTVEVEFVHSKVMGGNGEFAVVKIRLEPLERGSGIQFVSEAGPYAMPECFIGGVEEGIREAAKAGIIGGYPVVDIKATLLDGKYHEIDSNWRTFSAAAQGAFYEGMRRAGPQFLPH